jgi:hypothetical protein
MEGEGRGKGREKMRGEKGGKVREGEREITNATFLISLNMHLPKLVYKFVFKVLSPTVQGILGKSLLEAQRDNLI